MRQVARRFQDERFDAIRDMNPSYFGCANAVLEVPEGMVNLTSGEVIEHRIIARPGKPEDYITLHSPFRYNANLTWNDPGVQALLLWYRQIFAIGETRGYVPAVIGPEALKELNPLAHHALKCDGSLVRGRNVDKRFECWNGSTGYNAKSMRSNLIRKTFGPLAVNVDVSIITEKPGSSSGPSPDKARMRGAKVVIMDEPDANVRIMAHMLKKLTGGDPIFARFLNENGDEFPLLAKMILLCNQIPNIPHAGLPVRRRFKSTPHVSTWVDDAPATMAEQFKMRQFQNDPYFEDQLAMLAEPYLWVIAQYYMYYRVEKLKDPKIVVDSNNAYWNENDYFIKFEREMTMAAIIETRTMDGHVIQMKDVNAKITTVQLYNQFKSWFQAYVNNSECPNESVVRSEFIERWGQPNENLEWTGHKLRMMRAQINA
jgi:hypothetical protein